MALEILGMVVDQVEEIRHQLAERQIRAEPGHDRQQPRAAACENPQRLDRLRRPRLPRHGLPQGCAAFRAQGMQLDHPEELVKRFLRVVHLVEPAGRARQQNDPRFGLQRLPQPPTRIVVAHVPEHHVQVLDDQHEALLFPVGKVLQHPEAPILQRPVVMYGAQLLEGAV